MQQRAFAGARIADEKDETFASDYAVAQGCKHFLKMKITVERLGSLFAPSSAGCRESK